MIVVCEPISWGWEHVPINAALLEIVHRAFPSREIAFYAEESHIANVKSELETATSRAITWSPIPRPRRHAPPRDRWYADMRLIWQMLRVLRDAPDGHFLLCTANPEIVLALKAFVRLGAVQDKTIQIVCHGALAHLRGWRSRNPFMRIRDWRSALTLGNDRRIQFIILEEPVRRRVVDLLPAIEGHLAKLDHPIPSIEPHPPDVDFRPPFRFGFLGLATDAKGFPAFLEMAAILKQRFSDRVEFHAIGTISPDSAAQAMDALTIKPGVAKRDRSEFTRCVRRLHYVCLPYQSEHYELSPSGVLMDAIAFGKPLLSVGIPLVKELFDRFGDIGFLCTDTRNFCDTITKIVTEPDEGRYRRQVQALTAVRESRTSAALTPTYQGFTRRLVGADQGL
ncbi:MAG TPA: glycosyltransferase [Gemmatimonadaceae bacterium]|nr:glycosyltransferase [Gemmatimonadaceae bacterium]